MKRVNVSMPDEVFNAMETQRGDIPRSRFMLRAVAHYLELVPAVSGDEVSSEWSRDQSLRGQTESQTAGAPTVPVPAPTTLGVENESDDAMAPSLSVVVPAGSSPAPPLEKSAEPDPDEDFQLPKIAPRSWGR